MLSFGTKKKKRNWRETLEDDDVDNTAKNGERGEGIEEDAKALEAEFLAEEKVREEKERAEKERLAKIQAQAEMRKAAFSTDALF